MDLRVHRMAYQIIPALLREWRMVSFIPWKATPATAVVRTTTQLGTTRSSDMESLIHKYMPWHQTHFNELGVRAFLLLLAISDIMINNILKIDEYT